MQNPIYCETVQKSTGIEDALRPYAEMGAALCPIPSGGKSPVGHIESFAHDFSRDPKQWLEWSRHFGSCNWIMVAGPSGKIIVDIDVKKCGREAAWAAWAKWCGDRDLPVIKPHVSTPSGGWHCYFHTDETNLRQPPLIPGIADVRAGNGFVLIPPSHVDGAPYQWM
jgi:hypothetical protein